MTDLLDAEAPPTRTNGDSESGPSAPEEAVSSVASLRYRFEYLALTALVVLGAVLRCRGLTRGGLWTSDAWVALSSRVGIGTAWHMWANAPGFDLLERGWLLAHPGSTWWGQLPPLVLGVAAIPAIYGLVKFFRFSPWLGLGAALVVSVSPICVTFSTRYKEYSADFLLVCLVLFLAERARRHPAKGEFFALGAASTVGFAISASLLPIIVGVWLALGVPAVLGRRVIRPMVIPMALTTIICLVITEVFYRNLSPYLHLVWGNHFFNFGSPGAFINSVSFLAVGVYSGLTGVPVGTLFGYLMLFTVLSGLFALGAVRGPDVSSPVCVVAAAAAACAFGVIPLGTGRTDEVLYPALLLVFAAGMREVQQWFTGRTPGGGWLTWPIRAVGGGLIIGLLAIGISSGNQYQSVNVRGLAAEVHRNAQPGDHVVVDAFLRYAWALYEEPHPHIRFGSDWMPGFTVVSTQPQVFLAPSFGREGASDPVPWTRELARYNRIWFVATGVPDQSPFYVALQRAGWRSAEILHATNCEAILLVDRH